MIIMMDQNASESDVDRVVDRIRAHGFQAHIHRGAETLAVGVIGDTRGIGVNGFRSMRGVLAVTPIMKPYKMASRKFRPEGTVVNVGGVEIGGEEIVVIAGPCAIESEEQLMAVAKEVKAAGAKILRGSAFKPRTSPYDFQGLGEEGLRMMRKVRQATGLLVETEVMDTRDVEMVAGYVDMLRVGARNMQNFDLLKEIGKTDKPVILKRGMSATIKELMLAAEYMMKEGNHNIVLCERGIRTFETATRSTLDIGAVPVLREETHLPVIVDPSHAAGNRNYVGALAKAAVAAGSDGLLIEVHHEPEKALCDGPQALLPAQFAELMQQLREISRAVGRKL
ncbi:3-deoxy-7-phosphoheptulonate synthase [Candidatus Woesearchaeota archaeon]|nr:3-deoxy-7-phosphoheptulonate synthase [Candidatus Woesearchaeota archaeon]